MKLLLRRIHLTLALISAIFLLTLSISGALLLYAKDIQRTLFPAQWTISPPPTTINVEQLIATIEQQHTVNVSLITLPKDPSAPWQFRLASGIYMNVDPQTQSVIHQYDYYSTFYGFLMAFHRWLAIDNANKPLKVFMSIASLCLVVQLILGFYLWFKPKKPLKRLKVRWHAKAKTKYAQLHNVTGVIALLPLVFIAISGMAFHWSGPIQTLLNGLFVGEIQTLQKPTISESNTTRLQINQALKSGEKVFPHASLYRIYIPSKRTEPIRLRYTQPAEAHGNSWVWAVPSTGETIEYFDASRANWVTQVWNFRYPFHVGEFIGWPIKLLWLVISLTPIFFMVTGFYLYFSRKPNIRNVRG
ncbi:MULTISPECIES: PepSY-associated TM helix domain-containing protein [Thalassotalea]|uniref:PepSY-associated TM helix domain-containing protein n=1 Tax=Thalassotalea TaxID=1518149 RepID=UPI00094333CB|nr:MULTISPECIES: PepSY-associated TM helix domain-containing protein [Thalassotalea]OKY26094.1 hypothetical protein BI291_13185 [Thalassotalea sp. PP2-459]